MGYDLGLALRPAQTVIEKDAVVPGRRSQSDKIPMSESRLPRS